MAYEMRPGQGSAFPNDKKTSEKHPDMKGRVMLPNGETRWVSVWNKTTAAGQSWLSFSIGELCQAQGQGQAVYSAAHQPFPAKPQYHNAVAGFADPSHAQAKANGYQPEGRDLDSDIPF
jgi:hypothetical protein